MAQTEFDTADFLARLRDGDPAAYRALIRRFQMSLISVAASIIGSRAQAEEVVQDAWIAVYTGIGAFEGRSSLTTWLFSIVLNRARTRASREGRLVSLPSQMMEGTPAQEPSVPASAFKPDGHWVDAPRLWDEISPERIAGSRQLWDHAMEAIDRLPAGQRAVIVMRDLEGQEAEAVCALLEISPENQRVLLHRARARVRQTIDSLTGRPGSVTESRQARTTAGRRPGIVTRIFAATKMAMKATRPRQPEPRLSPA